MNPKVKCPLCGGVYLKAIYFGLPLRICADEGCACAEGPALFLMERLPISTAENEMGGWALFMYEGSYWHGLWDWLRY